jgi:hypothetical protein
MRVLTALSRITRASSSRQVYDVRALGWNAEATIQPSWHASAVVDATTGIAIYAATVATGALGWQVVSWSWSRRTRLQIRVQLGFLALPQRQVDMVFVTAINRSDHPINISSAGLEAQDGSGGLLVQPYPNIGSSIPGVVNPRDAGVRNMELEELKRLGFDPYRPVVGRVTTSTGETYHSKPTTLLRRT